MKSNILGIAALVCLGLSACADEPAVVQGRVDVPQLDVVAHDPVIIEEAGVYYLFTTGPGISVWSSRDLEHWTMQEPVFDPVPEWAFENVSGFTGHLWAPDISYHQGRYLLYYSVSSFGTNDSCIGLASNVTLDSKSPAFEWVDHGIVLKSEPGLNDWNAIDPNLIFDEAGRPFLAFGSFWQGLNLVRLTDGLDALAEPAVEPVVIASRRTQFAPASEPGAVPLQEKGNDAIEGAFIYRRDEYFYLFASVDFCCRGKDSTYKMIYGRSKSISGPYLDRAGLPMIKGGGTVLKAGDERWHGVGHNAVAKISGVEYAIFHGYDGSTTTGLPKLHIEELTWSEDGWPELSENE